MSQAKNGDKVKVHYTGKLKNDTIFDSSEGRDPLEFTIGSGEVIPGFDSAAVGMKIGETKTISIPPEEAYGGKRDELIVVANRSEIPDEIKLEVGIKLQINQPQGGPVTVVVTEMTDQTVTIDANHPLAGETLVFDIEMIGIS